MEGYRNYNSKLSVLNMLSTVNYWDSTMFIFSITLHQVLRPLLGVEDTVTVM